MLFAPFREGKSQLTRALKKLPEVPKNTTPSLEVCGIGGKGKQSIRR